jgi:hypothetical protein
MRLAASDIEKHAGRLNNRNNLISLLIKPPGEMIGMGGAWPGTSSPFTRSTPNQHACWLRMTYCPLAAGIRVWRAGRAVLEAAVGPEILFGAAPDRVFQQAVDAARVGNVVAAREVFQRR